MQRLNETMGALPVNKPADSSWEEMRLAMSALRRAEKPFRPAVSLNEIRGKVRVSSTGELMQVCIGRDGNPWLQASSGEEFVGLSANSMRVALLSNGVVSEQRWVA